MTLLIKDEFSAIKYDDYKYEGKYFSTANERPDLLRDKYKDGDLEDKMVAVTVCQFTKVVER